MICPICKENIVHYFATSSYTCRSCGNVLPNDISGGHLINLEKSNSSADLFTKASRFWNPFNRDPTWSIVFLCFLALIALGVIILVLA